MGAERRLALEACPESRPGRLTGAKLRHAASSVAPICPHSGAPCVLAWRSFSRVIHRGHFLDRPLDELGGDDVAAASLGAVQRGVDPPQQAGGVLTGPQLPDSR